MAKRNLAGGLSVTDEEAKAAVQICLPRTEARGRARWRGIAGGDPGEEAADRGQDGGRGAVGRQRRSFRVCGDHRRQARGMIEPDARRERRNFGVRVSLLFAAIFVVAGTNLPYLPVWLDWKGLGAREIAIITATPLVYPRAGDAGYRVCRRSGRRSSPLSDRAVLVWACGARRAVAVVGVLADPDLHRGLRPGLDHDHAADRDRGAERRQSGGTRLRPHAPVGIAQLHCRQPRGRLGRGALRGGVGHLAGGGWRRAHDGGRTYARPADRARPPEGGDQPATPAHVRRCGLAVLARCF